VFTVRNQQCMYETYSKYFDGHRRLSQSEESECMWTHDKNGITREFLKGATRGLREEGMERNVKGNYLKFLQHHSKFH
jgi:hypothetical protein